MRFDHQLLLGVQWGIVPNTDLNQSQWRRLASRTWLKVFRVSPKHEFAHFYLVLFKKNNFFFYIWKIDTGIYEWE